MKKLTLSEFPATVKLLITCYLITLGFGNIAAGVYTQKYVGISYDSLVATYGEDSHDHDADHSHPHEEDHEHPGPQDGSEYRMPEGLVNEFGEVEISFDDIQEMPHKVDLKLLLQDAHVHLFSHGVLSLTMALLIVWTRLPVLWKYLLIPIPFLGGTLDFAAMFLVKFVADGFAWLILFAGGLMGLSFTIVFFLSLYEMWLLPLKNKTVT